VKNKKEESEVKSRIKNEKMLILEQLKKTPIVQIACEKVGVGRSTYYRWKKDDPKFSSLTDAATTEGSLLVNDMAESQLLSAIKDKNLTAIIFWLKHHHPAYETRIELRHAVNRVDEKPTARHEQIIRELISFASSGAPFEIEEGDDSEKTDK